MICLGFDTAGARCAGALVSGGSVLAERSEAMASGQAERLLPMLEELLAEAGLGWSDLAVLGVGIGPGNFTGVRIAVSAARGLGLGLGVPALGVSGLEALAFGTAGPVLASIDARRGGLYLQRFGPGAEGPVLAPGGAPPDGWRAPGLSVVGEEAEALATQLGGTACAPAHPIAEAVARLACERASAASATGTAPARPAPLYLRAPDAAPPREAPPALLP